MIRQKLRTIMGPQQYRITRDGRLWVLATHWQLVGRWVDLEHIILTLPADDRGKKWLTGTNRVIYY